MLRNSFFIFLVLFMEYSCNTKKHSEATERVSVSNTIKQNDAEFITRAAGANWVEIQFGQLAQNNAHATEVKNLGKIAEKEHAVFLKDLQQLASKKNIELPTTTLSDTALETYKDFLHKTGTDFDTAYCNLMVNGYKEVISYFEKATVAAADADTRYWATSILLSLKHNLNFAISCQRKFGNGVELAAYPVK